MVHKFNSGHKHKLDNEKRRAIMPPAETLVELGLERNNTMVDIGCGGGYFTIAASKIVGDPAKVFALDISEEMLGEVQRKALETGVSNIHAIRVDEYDLKIENHSADFALLCNVLHEIEDKERFINEISRILKPYGKLAIIEWEKTEGDFGPPVNERIDKESIKDLLRGYGFYVLKSFNLGTDFYAITGGR